jgi:ArsR family transcriptional regulator, arsenate/arsenite/antimonite-responsive transcriptional repressor / arsenate reductase (thioredoxin)
MVRRVATETSSSQAAPPAFLLLTGHPVRWRVLSALACSDLRVGELCSRLGLPQNLVSYHLGRLRAERVVFRRRSAADGRDAYYVVDLKRCGELLAGSGAALHPGLRLAPPPPDLAQRRLRRRRTRILFLCTGNSARSQIAEALVQHLAGSAIEAHSAGSHPKPLHPNAVRVMRERGIAIEGRPSKHLSEFAEQRFGYVISLCDRVREVCPEFPGDPDLIHWSIPDPGQEGNSHEETYRAFERTAQELATRIPFLLELIEHMQPTQEVT